MKATSFLIRAARSSDWWENMSRKEQQNYLREHPNSKMAKQLNGKKPEKKPLTKTPKAQSVAPKKPASNIPQELKKFVKSPAQVEQYDAAKKLVDDFDHLHLTPGTGMMPTSNGKLSERKSVPKGGLSGFMSHLSSKGFKQDGAEEDGYTYFVKGDQTIRVRKPQPGVLWRGNGDAEVDFYSPFSSKPMKTPKYNGPVYD